LTKRTYFSSSLRGFLGVTLFTALPVAQLSYFGLCIKLRIVPYHRDRFELTGATCHTPTQALLEGTYGRSANDRFARECFFGAKPALRADFPDF
jgi:hypothetical protein